MQETELPIYEVDRGKKFVKWLHTLKDYGAKARVRARVERASYGDFGDWKTVGEGVREMRIHYGGGYRVYYTMRKQKIILLLLGGSKSAQQADIKKALKLAKEI